MAAHEAEEVGRLLEEGRQQTPKRTLRHVGVIACSAVALAAAAGMLYWTRARFLDDGLAADGTSLYTKEGFPVATMRKARRFARKALEDELKKATGIVDREVDEDSQVTNRSFTDHLNRIDPATLPKGLGAAQGQPPSDVARAGTYHGRCGCETGLQNITFWPAGHRRSASTVVAHHAAWVKFSHKVRRIHWTCGGMRYYKVMKVKLKAHQWFSLQVSVATKNSFLGVIEMCGKDSGVATFNTWRNTSYTSSVPFTSGTEGYACIKIPALLRTSAGTLIAFAEARKVTCSDFAQTDVVYKRSVDGGKTWGAMQTMVAVDGNPMEMGVCGHALVIGNVAPVQLRNDSKKHPNRILVPYMRNNFKTWIIHSDDDGLTWKGDQEIPGSTVTEDEPVCDRGMDFFGYDIDTLDFSSADSLVNFAAMLCYGSQDPYHTEQWRKTLTGPWQFVGVGPPGSLQLKSGRVLVPGYHSFIRGLEKDGVLPISQLYNNFALGHVLISDDDGDSWRLGEDWPVGNGANENQLVELSDGSVLTNSRALATGSPQWRLQARSTDSGETFTATEFTTQPQPFNGCQGSTIGVNDTVWVSGPDPPAAESLLQKVVDLMDCPVNLTGRKQVSVWRSTDGGRTYGSPKVVDPGLSAQTGMQPLLLAGKIGILYEQADPAPRFTVSDYLVEAAVENLKILLPSRFVYRELDAA